MSPGRRFLPGSIRFRLTAWYALLLAAVLVVLGVSVLELTEDRLRDEGVNRLKKTAADIERALWSPNNNRRRLAQLDNRIVLEDAGISLDSFGARGLLIQIVDVNDRVVEHSPYAPEDRILFPRPTATGEDRTAVDVVELGEVDIRVIRHSVKLPISSGADGPAVGSVLVAEPLSTFHATLGSLRLTLLRTSTAGLALAMLGGWLLAGRALKPVSRVTAAAAQIAAGDGSAASLTTRLRVPESGDEIARLSATFNAMLDRLQASFVAQQRFVADASHELRTPLTAIRGNVEVLSRQVAARGVGPEVNGDVGAALDDVKRESARMGRLLDDLLLLARSDAPTTETYASRPVRLDEIARDAVRSAAALVGGQRLEVLAPTPVAVSGDADRLLQLLLILVENALRHTPAGAAVTVEVMPAAGGVARLVVRDEGEGIAPEHLPHLFDRFYRADGARGRATGGTGLGLAIARAIARGHGGEIGVASTPGRGTTFTVVLPAGEPVAASEGATGSR